MSVRLNYEAFGTYKTTKMRVIQMRERERYIQQFAKALQLTEVLVCTSRLKVKHLPALVMNTSSRCMQRENK